METNSISFYSWSPPETSKLEKRKNKIKSNDELVRNIEVMPEDDDWEPWNDEAATPKSYRVDWNDEWHRDPGYYWGDDDFDSFFTTGGTADSATTNGTAPSVGVTTRRSHERGTHKCSSKKPKIESPMTADSKKSEQDNRHGKTAGAEAPKTTAGTEAPEMSARTDAPQITARADVLQTTAGTDATQTTAGTDAPQTTAGTDAPRTIAGTGSPQTTAETIPKTEDKDHEHKTDSDFDDPWRTEGLYYDFTIETCMTSVDELEKNEYLSSRGFGNAIFRCGKIFHSHSKV